jgi:hypothetical protein
LLLASRALAGSEVEVVYAVGELKTPAECQYSKYPGLKAFIEGGHGNSFADENEGLKFKQGIGLIKPTLNIWFVRLLCSCLQLAPSLTLSFQTGMAQRCSR